MKRILEKYLGAWKFALRTAVGSQPRLRSNVNPVLTNLILMAGLAGLCAFAQHDATSQMPAFGSIAAEAKRFLENDSAFLPKTILTEPGILKGRWLPGTRSGMLTVSLRFTNRVEAEKEGAHFHEDEFTLTLQSFTNFVRLDFTAAYGRFQVYGVDIDREGTQEIVLCHFAGENQPLSCGSKPATLRCLISYQFGFSVQAFSFHRQASN